MQNYRLEKICEVLVQCIEKMPGGTDLTIKVLVDEPMSRHTTLKVGGPAEVYMCPGGNVFPLFCFELISRARREKIPLFILGGGSNIAVSDKGIRGIVLDVSDWKGRVNSGEGFVFKSGTSVDEAADTAAASGFSGLEFLAGMPGTIGGAVWMNARCYGRETADALSWADIIDFSGGQEPENKRIRIGDSPLQAGFDYKKSPFQNMDCLILNAAFNLKKKRGKEKITAEMEKNRQDREEKGHYLFPCAGSAFKNNRGFGKPTGQIIDELGLRGLQKGGAQIAPFHGNIVINKDGATAADIRALMNETAAKVKTAAGFILEPEILFVGEW